MIHGSPRTIKRVSSSIFSMTLLRTLFFICCSSAFMLGSFGKQKRKSSLSWILLDTFHAGDAAALWPSPESSNSNLRWYSSEILGFCQWVLLGFVFAEKLVVGSIINVILENISNLANMYKCTSVREYFVSHIPQLPPLSFFLLFYLFLLCCHCCKQISYFHVVYICHSLELPLDKHKPRWDRSNRILLLTLH